LQVANKKVILSVCVLHVEGCVLTKIETLQRGQGVAVFPLV
jgi:hypothetical protein